MSRRGSVFSSAGSLRLEYVAFKNLIGASSDGTAVHLWGDNNILTVSDCTFTDIAGAGRGGAIYVAANKTIFVNINSCEFRSNRTTGAANGGAAFIGAPCAVTDTRFIGNRAEKNSGGALYIGGAGSLLQGCIFSGNYANAQDYKGGGAVYITAECRIKDCAFTGNSTFTGANGGSGGAVYVASGGATIAASLFRENKAYTAGGCHVASGVVKFEGCDFERNTSVGSGGAVFVNWSQSTVSASFDGCTITDNTSGQAGTIYINYYFYPNYDDWGLGQKQLDITNSVLRGNTSEAFCS